MSDLSKLAKPFVKIEDPTVIHEIRSYVEANLPLIGHIQMACGYLAFCKGGDNQEILITPREKNSKWGNVLDFTYWTRELSKKMGKGHRCGKTTILSSWLMGIDLGVDVNNIRLMLWEEMGGPQLVAQILQQFPVEEREAVRQTLYLYLAREILEDSVSSQFGSVIAGTIGKMGILIITDDQD